MLAENANLEPAEYRRRVLDYLLQRKRGDYPGTAEIVIALAIPFGEMMEVLETLEMEGAIEAIKAESHPPSWRVELTARGRNMAKGRAAQMRRAQAAIVFNQHIDA